MRFCLSIFLLLLAATTHAVEKNTLPGTRPIGMGDAFTAAADDANSVRRNPAGLPRLGVYAFELERTPGSLFGELETNYLSAVVPISDRSAFGADWINVGISDDELNAGRSRFNFSYGYLPSTYLSVGANLKYVTQSVSLDNKSRGAASGWGTDIGVIVRPTHRWSVGVLVQDVISFGSGEGITRGMWIRHHPDVSEEISNTIYRLGVAYRPTSRWLLAADLTDRWRDRFHFGAEFFPNTNFALRAGFQKDLQTDEAPTYSLGGSVKFRWLNFNTAYLIPPTLPATLYAGLSFNFDYRKLPVRIEHIRIKDLYPVHYHYYASPNYHDSQIITYREPSTPPILTDADWERYYPLTSSDSIGRIWLKNESHEPVTVHIKLFMDRYVGRDGTEVALGDVELPPRKRTSVPIRQIVLTSSAVELPRVQPVQAEIKVIESGGAAFQTATTTVKLHGNHTTLLDDVGKLGSFITSEDSTVEAFTEAVFAEFAKEIDGIKHTGIPIGLYRAMLLFNALHGISYKTDPNIPFASGTNDDIKYPHEMLARLTEQISGDGKSSVFGDCDDSTALYCSLLEAVGIKTALIQLPSHVMMAFKLGEISIDRAQQVNLPYYVPINGQVWIPVETTLIKDGFFAAWKVAYEEIQRTGVGTSTTTVEEAWEKYGISPVRGSKQSFSIPKDLTFGKIQSDLASPWLQEFLKAYLNINN